MNPHCIQITEAHVRVLLYYGDTDMACNFMMGQQFADQLGLKVLTDHEQLIKQINNDRSTNQKDQF